MRGGVVRTLNADDLTNCGVGTRVRGGGAYQQPDDEEADSDSSEFVAPVTVCEVFQLGD